MFIFAGFVGWWIFLVMLFFALYIFAKELSGLLEHLRLYIQVILYILCMLVGYLVVYIVNYYVSYEFVSALLLILAWKLSFLLFGFIWRYKDEQTKKTEYNIVLTEGEQQWANTICIVGMAILGVVLSIKEHSNEYFGMASSAMAIWLGSYLSIQKIQKNHTIQEVWNDWKQTFSINSIGVPIVGGIFMAALLVAFLCESVQKKLENVYGFFGGVGLGVLAFVLFAVIYAQIDIRKKKKMKDENNKG